MLLKVHILLHQLYNHKFTVQIQLANLHSVCVVMVSVFISKLVDRGCNTHSSQTKDYKISGRYIHEQMYIAFHSFLVPSSPGTAYHQQYVKPVPLASSMQVQGPLPFPCNPRCKYGPTMSLRVNTISILTVQYGHAQSNYT